MHLEMMRPKMSGQDVLKALKKNPATAGIPVVVLTGLSQRNASRLQDDGDFAFLEKSALALDQGSEILLAALAKIITTLPAKRSLKVASGQKELRVVLPQRPCLTY